MKIKTLKKQLDSLVERRRKVETDKTRVDHMLHSNLKRRKDRLEQQVDIGNIEEKRDRLEVESDRKRNINNQLKRIFDRVNGKLCLLSHARSVKVKRCL